MIATSSFIEKANFAKAQAFSSTIYKELLSSLVSEWTFDEGVQGVDRTATNTDVKDTWGSNHGTVYGSPQIKGGDDCVYGRCIEFNKTGDYVNCGSNDNLNLRDKITITVWANAGSSQATIYSNIVDRSGFYLIHLHQTLPSKIAFNVVSGGSVRQTSSNARINANEWTFITVAYDGRYGSVYKNGTLSNQRDFGSVGTIDSNTNNLSIGARQDGSWPFDGLIDDVRIYNSTLSSAQIKQNYIAGLDSMLNKGTLSKDEYNERIQALANPN